MLSRTASPRLLTVLLLCLALALPSVALAGKKGKKGAAKATAATETSQAVTNSKASVGGDDDAYAREVLEFLEISGALAGADTMMTGLLEQMRPMAPELPEEFWQGLAEEFDVNDLSRLLIPVYQRHFSQAEVREAAAFYKTPPGKKFARLAPTLAQEGMEVGQNWGRDVATRVMEKIEAAKQAE